MVSIAEMTDLHLWKPVDAEALVQDMLTYSIQTHFEKNHLATQVPVISEISTNINTLAHPACVLYDCGPVRSIGGGYWRFALSVYLFSNDPVGGAEFSRILWELISHWAYKNSQHSGVGTVIDVTLTGFKRNGPDKWNLARDVHMWAMEDVLIRAYSPERTEL